MARRRHSEEAIIAAPAGRTSLRPLAALQTRVVRYPALVVAAVAALLVSALTTLALPLALRRLIDHGFASGDRGFVDAYFVMLVVLAGLLAAASSSRYYFVTVLGERVVADLRRDLHAHVLTLSPGFFDRARSGELVSRLAADTTQLKAAVGSSLSQALRNGLLFLGATAMMIVTSPRLSALVVAAIPLIVLPIAGFGRRVRRETAESQAELASANAFAAEAIGGVRTIQAFGAEDAAQARFAGLVEKTFGAARRATRMRALLTGFAIFLVFASVVAVLWWGAQAVIAGTMTPGHLGQFVLYAVLAAGALGELSQVSGELAQAAGSTERISALLDERPAIAAPVAPLVLPRPSRGGIRFENVSFAYEGGPPTLHGIDLDIRPGERVAVVGPSGAGKSTLIALLLRFYDPTGGRVLVDGVDIRTVDPRALRRQIALVPQDPTIFAQSVLDNVGLADATSDRDRIAASLAAAHAEAFVAALPRGMDTPVGERGITLSGGQRQRIAVARAILKDAPILLLDEATSALDAESERAVQLSLDRLLSGRTSIVIAHRLATVRAADRIIVLDHGRIAEQGDHVSLVARGGLYARLAALQFIGGEDAAAPPRPLSSSHLHNAETIR